MTLFEIFKALGVIPALDTELTSLVTQSSLGPPGTAYLC